MTDNASLSLQAIYARALSMASKAYYLPSIAVDTQSAIEDMNLVQARIQRINLFSPNESLDELSSKDLLYMTVPFIMAELESNAVAARRAERVTRLQKAKACLVSFASLLKSYSVIPEDEMKLHSERASTSNPAKRRETKIAQFKQQTDVKQAIAGLREKHHLPQVDISNNYDLVASLLSAQPATSTPDGDDDDTACTNMEQIKTELDLLENAAPEPEETQLTQSQDVSEDTTWKLDMPSTSLTGSQGPILDNDGRPLRPFTILPAGAGERARMQSEVFRPDHRLPTMGIDEYLEEEMRRGNIISGGGPESETKLTRSEQLALDSEMDGTAEGDTKAETKRQEDEKWARFTDVNPRGAGNTMNRG